MYYGRCQWGATGSGIRELHPDPALAALTAAFTHFQNAERVARHPAELGGDLVQLHHLRDLLDLEIAARARAFDEAGQAELEGSTDTFHWIRHNCHASSTSALNSLNVGRDMEKLPSSVAAVEAAEIGFGHLAIIATTQRALADSPTDATIDEVVLLEHARDSSVGRFWHECLHLRHQADQEGFLDDHRRQVAARKLILSTAPDGAMFLKGFLDAVGGATFRTALETLARPCGNSDVRNRKARLADALVELSQHALDSGTLPTRNGIRPHVQVTASLETLIGSKGAPAAEMEFAGPVPAATAQRFACDAAIRRVLFDSKSAVVDVGRAARVPAAPTRGALIARDRGCVWPGCERPASFTAAHHLQPWAKGGETTLANLVLLCHRHHWAVHEGGWELLRDPDGNLTAIPPVPRNPWYDPSRAPDLPAA
jgi:hypothetical protein